MDTLAAFAAAIFFVIVVPMIAVVATGPHSAYERNDPSYRRAKWKRRAALGGTDAA